MLIDKIRKHVKGFEVAKNKEQKQFYLLGLSLNKVKMAQALIAVDDVLNTKNFPHCPVILNGWNLALSEIRKAIESEEQDK